MSGDRHPYDNPVYPDNVYGHALDLLRRANLRSGPTEPMSVHLDLGCGFGRIAESITTEFQLGYIGIDGDSIGPASLRALGYEAHQLWFGEYEQTLDSVRSLIGDRRLSSISMLDTLEHLADGDTVLRVIQAIAREHEAPVVISVPNVAHQDVGFKLAFGRWEYTEAGLLDHTHLRLFSNDVLERQLRTAGLYTVDAADVVQVESDQHFPATHPALASGTHLAAFLQRLRSNVDAFSTANQFVRLCIAGRRNPQLPYLAPVSAKRPFLSIITRTQGRRPHTLREVFVCLAGQTDTDFEILVIGHRLSTTQQLSVERLIDDNPEWLRSKIRMIRVEDGNRTRPLNAGFEQAQGDYIAILDDDDAPFAHWVETFRDLAIAYPGRMLRANALRQDVTSVTVGGKLGLRAVGSPLKLWQTEFDLFAHFEVNQSPPICIAFPRGVFHDLKVTFDETLTTTEDWDYILRTALLVGVASSDKVTGLYRWWVTDESSRSVHTNEEWQHNHKTIWMKLDQSASLMPAGSIGRIRRLMNERDEQRSRADFLQGRLDSSEGNARRETSYQLGRNHAELMEQLANLLNSTSWKISSPVRWVGHLMGKRNEGFPVARMSSEELIRAIEIVHASTSWRLTRHVRALKGARR